MKEMNPVLLAARIVMGFTGIMQLALSQIHIAAISGLFVREIGFYLFGFILLGVILVALLFSFDEEKRDSYVQTAITAVAASAAGAYTAVLMIGSLGHEQSKAVFADVSRAFYLTIAGIALYLIGLCVIIANRWMKAKKQ